MCWIANAQEKARLTVSNIEYIDRTLMIKHLLTRCARLIILGILFSFPLFASAANTTLIEMLSRPDCLHCNEEKSYLEQLQKKRNDIEVVIYNIEEPQGKDLFERVTRTESLSKSTPITAVGSSVIQGFDSTQTTGKRIEDLIERNTGSPTQGFESILAAGGSKAVEKVVGASCDDGTVCKNPDSEPILVNIPFVGTVDVAKYSLPTLSGILGFIDGFNPCAMWVLVTFLLVLMQLGDRLKIWMVAGIFILSETITYYLILNVWFTAWDFVGLDAWVTPIIGLVAIGGGLFFLYEWKFSDGTCQVTDIKKRSEISGRIKKLANQPFTWFTLVGIVGLAFSVNVIEFACSIGIPQTFTKVLEINNLSLLQSQALILVYIFFYMIDDFIVFGLALWGAGKLQQTQTYARWCNLFGGILMIILGLLLLVDPDILKF